MGDHEAIPTTTQARFPWRAAVRTGFATFLAFCVAGAAAAPLIASTVGQLLPGTPYPAWVLSAGGVLAAIALLINRLALLPAVAGFVARIGLGPSPRG